MSGKIIIKDVEPQQDTRKDFSLTDTFRMPERFKMLNHLVMRDLNSSRDNPTFRKYSKKDILCFLKDPYRFERQLRDACYNVYGFSSHFRRLIHYFEGLNDLAYVISPFGADLTKRSLQLMKSNFSKVARTMEAFQPKSQFPKIINACLVGDLFFGTLWVTQDNITVQQLPADYCRIASSEGNVYNASFDFRYFDKYPEKLRYFPAEFGLKYEQYKNNKLKNWIELDSPTSFAIKCTSGIGAYALPPFAGILPEIYDLDEYKALKLTRTELENYAILVMKLGLNADGSWQIDLDKARDFWSNLDGVLPDAVGSVLTPMGVEKISFDRSSNPDSSTVSDATESIFSAAGVSSLLFNSSKASSNALLLSIKADQSIVYGIVKSIADMVNRYIQSTTYGKNFKVTFLDVSPFNRDEVGGQYLKMCNVGMPMVSYLAAAYGMSQSDMDNLNLLEDRILNIKERFMPLRTSNTMSSSDNADGGRPTSDIGELSDNGEISQERDEG